MLLERDEQVREAAAKKAIQRIQHDREHKASARVKPLLVHIEGQLFKPRLNSTTMMEDCGVRDHAVSTRFTCDLGTAPRAYICKRRLETAAELLADTDWKIWKVGFMVCYPNLGTFGKAFKGWSGSTASDYRKAARKAATEAGSLEQDLGELARALLQGEVGEMERGQRGRLARHLLSFDEEPPRTLAFDGAKLERGLALSHWEDLWHLPAEEQQELVRRPYGLRTTALFDVLREKSREQGRKDRQAGVRLAETALASLDGIAAYLTPDELANRKAQGWAWLGNALLLAFDHPAAGRTFAKARKVLPKDPDPEVLAEICDFEADVFLFRSEFEQALKLNDRAVELFRSVGKNELLARSLVARATTIGRARGWESSIPDLLAALQLLDPTSQPYLALAAHHNLMSVYALCGRHSEAMERLPEARSLCERVADPVAVHHLQWTEGFIRQAQGDYEAAERQASKARQGFASLGEVGYAAAVDLDLAEIALELGRPSKAVTRALRAIPVFESYKNHREAVAALAVLGKVVAEQVIRLEVVREVRGYLQDLLQNPIRFKK